MLQRQVSLFYWLATTYMICQLEVMTIAVTTSANDFASILLSVNDCFITSTVKPDNSKILMY